MSLFPFLDQETEQMTETQEKQESLLCEYEYDFEKGCFTGRKLYGVDALKMWIIKTIRTTRYRYMIYTWDYGIEIDDIINKPYRHDLIESEVARNIEEALTVHEKIYGISNFSSRFEGSTLHIEFTVITDIGEVKIHESYSKL